MIKAVIFDLDGLIIDSEPFWKEVEILKFRKVNVQLTEEKCTQTMGMRLNEVIAYWYEKFPWGEMTFSELEEEILEEMENVMRNKAEALKGVHDVIELFQRKKLKLAVASSSCMRLILAALETLNIKEKFLVIHSAEYEELGKPHPAVFLTTAQKLNVQPEECLVLEDSIAGMKAGVAAGMRVIAVPASQDFHKKEYELAFAKIPSLLEFDVQFLN